MELLLDRKYKKTDYTIGNLYIEGVLFCQAVEDKDRGLRQDMKLSEIQKLKVYGKTAIPTGRYKIILSYSPKFKKTLPEIKDVPGYSGIRIHSGVNADDSLGCLILGENKIKGGVVNSRITVEKLMARLRGQKDIWITIK